MITTFYILDGLTCDLLLGKHLSKQIISMFITLEVNKRSLEPRARRSEVIPKPFQSDVLKGKLKTRNKNIKKSSKCPARTQDLSWQKENKVVFTFTSGSQNGKRLTS